MKILSEITGKIYNSIEECEKAELEFKKNKEIKNKEKENIKNKLEEAKVEFEKSIEATEKALAKYKKLKREYNEIFHKENPPKNLEDLVDIFFGF